jgi:hypothetical protein
VYGTSPGPLDRICDVGCTVTTSDGGTRSYSCQGAGLNAGQKDPKLCGEGRLDQALPTRIQSFRPTRLAGLCAAHRVKEHDLKDEQLVVLAGYLGEIETQQDA